MATNNDLSKKILTENYEVQLESLIQEFYEDRIEDLNLVKNALNEGNFRLISETAHKWKGYAKPYGFAHLGELGATIEEKAKAGETESLGMYLEEASEYMALKKNQFELEDK
tara:strand:+ start:121 stop:456 length:336 start_codon:yes stop_codon:yes gene_type:complete